MPVYEATHNVEGAGFVTAWRHVSGRHVNEPLDENGRVVVPDPEEDHVDEVLLADADNYVEVDEDYEPPVEDNQEEQEEPVEDEEEEEAEEVEARELPDDVDDYMDRNVRTVKAAVREDQPDANRLNDLLEYERRNKDRKSLVEWLENRVEEAEEEA